jgi:hypothetical protein
MMAGRPDHVAKAPPFCPKGAVVELKREIVDEKGGKEGEGGRPATNLWPTSHAWPSLNPYFHLPLHIVPLMLTQKHQKQTQFLSSFSKILFIFYFFEILDFILCNDEINMLWKRSK